MLIYGRLDDLQVREGTCISAIADREAKKTDSLPDSSYPRAEARETIISASRTLVPSYKVTKIPGLK